MKVRQRILQIRRRVAAVTVTVFVALFSGIYVQMASGNDPVLSSGTKAKTTAGSTTTQSDVPSPVTTRQS